MSNKSKLRFQVVPFEEVEAAKRRARTKTATARVDVNKLTLDDDLRMRLTAIDRKLDTIMQAIRDRR